MCKKYDGYYELGRSSMFIPFKRMYCEKHDFHPSMFCLPGYYNTDLLINKFGKPFVLQSNTITKNKKDIEYIVEMGIDIGNDIWLVAEEGVVNDISDHSVGNLVIYYPAGKNIKNLIKKIKKIDCSYYTYKGKINILCKSNDQYYTREFTINKPVIDIDLYYNDGFSDIHDIIVKNLNNRKSSGMVLLHGKVGTGKTTYIRYLTHLIDKQIIYIPSNLINSISDPELIPFMLDHPNSVLIMEDAENVVSNRDINSGQGVSNILNLSDGIIGDCVNVQIIATFNVAVDKIDPALLRKGRLFAKWEFKDLDVKKVKKLSKKLKIDVNREMSLANLFNYDDMSFSEEKKPVIGFQAQ